MHLTQQQTGILRGMAAGAIVALAIVGAGGPLNPFGFQATLPLADRLAVAAKAAVVPGLCLTIAVARLASYRFFTLADIDAAAGAPDSRQARVLQALLQNTLEQTVIALIAYAGWAVAMPPATLSALPLAAIAFGLGRVLFFARYGHGAVARSLGFTLTFYPSLALLLAATVALTRAGL